MNAMMRGPRVSMRIFKGSGAMQTFRGMVAEQSQPRAEFAMGYSLRLQPVQGLAAPSTWAVPQRMLTAGLLWLWNDGKGGVVLGVWALIALLYCLAGK